MIVLGIDPGTANTGYGVIRSRDGRLSALDGGVIQTRPAASPEQRLATIHAAALELIDEHDVDVVALEDLYFGLNTRSAFAVGQARGVVLLAGGQRGLSCHSYTPQQVKAAVCGHGRAPKEQVARMVAAMLSLGQAPARDHASDALAVAICHANAAPLSRALQGLAQTASPPTGGAPAR